MSNIVDEDTGLVPSPIKEWLVIEQGSLRIGLIGLVEESA